jgi:hypothetical protein
MHFNFNQSFIYWEPVKNHAQYKADILPVILNNENKLNQHSTYNNCFISWGTNVQINYNNIVQEAIFPAIDRMIEEIGLNMPDSYHLFDIWTNYYKEYGNQNIHIHEKTDISGVYLLHLEDPNSTVFYSFCDNPLMDVYKETTEIEEGNIILFPSHLPHEAKGTKKDRITISFDIKCNFKNLLLSTLNYDTSNTDEEGSGYSDGTRKETITINRPGKPKGVWNKQIYKK